ncbi:MAG: metal-dependent hydrolase [Candidatus Heimdallarchaeota archaeon]|nr:metal-dependent hydrolase [Candidatus Heimdallarchaeota archaeon]
MYEDLVNQIRDFPSELESLIAKIDELSLDLPIRKGAWTIRQSINHLVDSHVNSFIRIKFTISEDDPTIMPYNEKLWSEMKDTKEMDILSTIQIIRGLHMRMSFLLENLSAEDWDRPLTHPDVGKLKLSEYVKVAADHGSLHLNSIINSLNL